MNEFNPVTLDRPAEAPAPGGNVLVIDDDVAVGMVLSRAVTRFGFTAGVATDGTKGIALFRSDPSRYNLVLLDFKLPGMSSGEVYNELRLVRPELPVVLMSGYNREEAMEKSAGMDLAGFLHKPFNMETLASVLGFALAA
jgi:two-component system, cell cycle sensor histidine kinase and response regulator CckA